MVTIVSAGSTEEGYRIVGALRHPPETNIVKHTLIDKYTHTHTQSTQSLRAISINAAVAKLSRMSVIFFLIWKTKPFEFELSWLRVRQQHPHTGVFLHGKMEIHIDFGVPLTEKHVDEERGLETWTSC